MCSRKLTRIAHVIPQVEQLRQAYSTHVDNVVTLTDRRLGMLSVRQGRTERQHEPTQILVQREELEHLPWHFRVGRLVLLVLACRVGRDILRIQIANLIDIEWNAALVSSPCPLRVQTPRRLILVDVDGLVQLLELVLLAPVLRVLQLLERLLRYKLARAQVPKQSLVIVGCWCLPIARIVVALLLAQRLELVQRADLTFSQVGYVSSRPLRSC